MMSTSLIIVGVGMYVAAFSIRYIPGYRNSDWEALHGEYVKLVHAQKAATVEDIEELLRGK